LQPGSKGEGMNRNHQGWKAVRGVSLLLALLLLLSPFSAGGLEGHARFGRQGHDIVWPFPYEDGFFQEPGTQYRQGLARASLGMALSAFRKAGAPVADSHLDIAALFLELGFHEPLFSQYNRQPTINTIATAMAQKQLGEYTLLAVAVSGGGYQDEWQSNFSIGDSLHHIGFDSAAQQVVQRVSAYLTQHRLHDRPVKIWITGFSRAAATANRAAALLLDKRMVAPVDLYAYTFATPNVTRQEDAEGYPAIFNVVGAFDPVPMVPFADWGFSRYGTTFVLPAPQLNSDYVRRVAPVAAGFQRFTGNPFWANYSGVSAVSKFLSSLSENVTTTEEYTQKVQPMLMDLWAIRKQPLRMLTSFVRHIAFKDRGLRGVLGNLFAITTNSLGESMMQEAGVYQNQWQPGRSLTDNLAREHFPEGYMAWLHAHDSLEAMASPTGVYRQIALTGYSDIQVVNEEGEVFFYWRFTDAGEMEQSLDGALLFSQAGDEQVLSLPSDRAYTLRLQPDAFETTSLTVKEGRAGLTRMQVYELPAMDLAPGSRWSLALPQMRDELEPGASRYTLTGEGASHPLVYQEFATTLSANEMNSTFTTLFAQNMVIGLSVLLLVVLLLLFSVMLLIRARRRSNHKRYLKQHGTPLTRARFRQHFINRSQAYNIPIKILAFFLLASGAVMAVIFVRMMAAWVQEIRLIQQKSLLLFTLMYYVPFGVLLLCCALPALTTGVYALFWLVDPYHLCTSRIHGRIALLFTLGLLLVLTRPAYSFFSITLLIVTPLQLLFLLILLNLMRRVIKPKIEKSLPATASS